MKPGAIYLSFLVRMWSDEQQAGGEGESPAWQGEVIHIQTGSKVSFHDMGQLFRYLQERLKEEE
jgi:hypothetical protein